MLQMKQRPRIYYTATQKALMWERWQKGESLHSIAQRFDRGHSSIQRLFADTGGIRPVPRRRSPLALTVAEREEISRAGVAARALRSMAASLARAPSTVSGELRRNGGRRGYRASQAEWAAWDRARRPKTCKLVENRALARSVAEKLELAWSPEQIAGWLKRTYPDDETFQVSHETIYRSLFIQARGALKKALLQPLRRTRVMRRSRHASLKGEGLGKITDTVSIRARAAAIEDRPCRVTGKATCCSAPTTARSPRWLSATHAT
jgi:IS30 family transposase